MFFNHVKSLPKITIRFMRANQISEVPFDNLKETVVATDFDLTIKYPCYQVKDNLLKTITSLRGGLNTLACMNQIKNNSLGYYLVSAAAPGPLIADTLATEMKSIYVDDTSYDLRHFFLDNDTLLLKHIPQQRIKKTTLKNEQNNNQELNYVMVDNIILPGYQKAAGVITKIKDEFVSDKKIKNIIFIDDFLPNVFFFPEEFMNLIANNISDKLQDEITIFSVWLDPAFELSNSNMVAKKLCNEDSNHPLYKPLQIFFPADHRVIDLTKDQYKGIFNCGILSQNSYSTEEEICDAKTRIYQTYLEQVQNPISKVPKL